MTFIRTKSAPDFSVVLLELEHALEILDSLKGKGEIGVDRSGR